MSDGFEITSSPVTALLGASLIVGAERSDDHDLKLYVGARYRGLYVVVPAGDQADAIESAWRARGHLFLGPAPSSDIVFSDADPVARGECR